MPKQRRQPTRVREPVQVYLAQAERDLLDRLAPDPAFARADAAVLRRELDPRRYVGRAPEQTVEYLEGPIRELLTSLGGGLEAHGQASLAAAAFSLAWTRTRGNGGWMTFGGETELDSLRHATRLDADTAWATVASEVTRIVAGSRGSYGISQALIHASLVNGLTTQGAPHDAAFAAWDQAHSVIALRTPRMADEDDPDEPYAPPQELVANTTGEIDVVFSEAVIGATAHPGQENRRRALLALEILLTHRPEAVAKALAATLPALDEPALLSWLLKVAADADAARPPVADLCHPVLQGHPTGPHLTARALDSRPLAHRAPPPPRAPPAPRRSIGLDSAGRLQRGPG